MIIGIIKQESKNVDGMSTSVWYSILSREVETSYDGRDETLSILGMHSVLNENGDTEHMKSWSYNSPYA